VNLKYPGQRFLALLGMTGSRLLLDYYYEKMGWDKQTGKPLPETRELPRAKSTGRLSYEKVTFGNSSLWQRPQGVLADALKS